MEQVTETRSSKGYFRSSPSTAFDQYLQDIQKLPLINDPEEERRLARRAQKGDEKAAERLVTANLRFVISYVKKYQGHGLDLSELVAIGNEGLLKAVRKFDPDQGVKFISYAVWWVRQAVLKALAEQTRSVRIPLNQNSQLIRLARAETILAQVLKRDPTEDEVSRLLEETPEVVRAAKQMSATEVSLDAPIDRSDREASTLGERFAGVDGTEIEEVTDYKLMREFIDRVFKKYLTPRERKILYLYYGLEEGSEAKRPSVQVGDPFEEKRLIEACLELLDAGLAVGVQDLGAAGISCAASETAASFRLLRQRLGVDLDHQHRHDPDGVRVARVQDDLPGGPLGEVVVLSACELTHTQARPLPADPCPPL
jgi:RNA polymerase primary sigma factor